ncbi:MAG: hypothetical protein WAW63_03855 [Candidatus Saccharimonadales bacterium]|nr:hypothetical protein [Candidatus Saccharibacteria bacterium]
MKFCETSILWKTDASTKGKLVPITLLHPCDLSNVTGIISIGIGSSVTTARHILSGLGRTDFVIALWPFEAFPPDKTSLYYVCEEAPFQVIAWLKLQGCTITRAIGHSQGANVLIAHAAKYPHSLEKIALMSPTLTPENWPKSYAATRVIAGLALNGVYFSFSRDVEDKRTAKEAKGYLLGELKQRTHGLHNRLSESFMSALDGGLSSATQKILARGKPRLNLYCGAVDFVSSVRLIARALQIPKESIHILPGGHTSLSSIKGEAQLAEVLRQLSSIKD